MLPAFTLIEQMGKKVNMHKIRHSVRILTVVALTTVTGIAEEYFTLESGASWLKWLPDQPSRSEITTTGYLGFTLNAQLNYKDIIRLHNLKYEFSNGIAAPTVKSRETLIKEKTGTAGYILFSLVSDFLLPKTKYNLGFLLQADYQDYRATVHFNDEVTYIPYNYEDSHSITYYRSGDEAEFYTRFNDFFAGISSGSSPNSPNYARAFIGIGTSMYQKPYTFRIGEMELDDIITDTRFQGIFLGLGLIANHPLTMDTNLDFFLTYHQGAGDMVLFKNKVSITEIAGNNGSSIYYSAMESRITYHKALIPKTLTASAEGEFRIKSFDLKTPDTTLQNAPNMNRDYFFGIKLNLTYQL